MQYSQITAILLTVITFACGTSNIETTERECDYPCDFVRTVSKQLNYSLEVNSVNKHEIRLWVIYEGTTGTELFILKDVDSNTYLTRYLIQEDEDSQDLKIDSINVAVLQPKISTKDLTNKLYNIGFKKMIDQPDSIKHMIADGTTHILELRDSTYYKCVNYNTPHLFEDINNQSFMAILEELETNFNWEYYWW